MNDMTDMQIQNEQPAVETQPVPEVQPAVETQPAATVYETYPTADAPKEEPVSKREAKKRVKAEKKAEKKAQKKAAKANAKKGGAGKKFLLAISLGLCFGLFAGAGFYGMRLASLEYARQESKEELADWKDTLEEVYEKVEKFLRSGKVDGNGNLQIQYSSEDVSDVVEDVMPAMVSITNNYTLVGTGFWGQQIQQKARSEGSGIIVGETDEELLIVSNNHVVEGTNKLTVTFVDGTTAEAVIKGLDAKMDLGVIAVPLKNLTVKTLDRISVAKLGDSDTLRLGQPVIAIGNALGYGQSVTNGIISALNREVEMEDGTKNTFIQTNAEINHGNSGGALLNMKGEVIGINSMKSGGTSVEGMGYAIPITKANPIIAELMERVTREKLSQEESGYLGIVPQDITAQAMQMFNMPQGVFVYSLEEGGAAYNAGVKPGDILVKLDTNKITSSAELIDTLLYYRAGEKTTITVKRVVDGAYKEIVLDITLGKRPKE
jgi:serine protease Do